MSEHLHKAIFSESECLSEQQLYAYIDGKLTAQERYAVEKHMVDCELCSDAMEGLALLKNRAIVKETEALVKEKYSKKTEQKGPVIIPFNYKRTFAIAASVALLITAGYFFVHNFKKAGDNMAFNKETTVPEPQKKDDTPPVPEKTGVVQNETSVVKMDNMVEGQKEGPAKVKAEEVVILREERSKKETGNFYKDRDNQEQSTETTAADMNDIGGKDITLPVQTSQGAGSLNTGTIETEKTNEDKKRLITNTANTAPPVNTNTAPPQLAAENNKMLDADNVGDQTDAVYDEVQTKERAKADDASKNTNEEEERKKKASKSEEDKAAAEETQQVLKGLGKKAAKVVVDTESSAYRRESEATGAAATGNVSKTGEPIIVPEYKGGYNELQKFIKDNTDLTNCKGCTGTVTLRFTVKADGTLKNITTVKEVKKCKCLTTEAIRIVQKMPAWIPAKKAETAVDYEYTLPVSF